MQCNGACTTLAANRMQGWWRGLQHRAVDQPQFTLDAVLAKARFWQHWATMPLKAASEIAQQAAG